MKSKPLLCLALVLTGNAFAGIVYPAAPEEGRQIAQDQVRSFVRSDPDVFRKARFEDLTITNTCRIYTVSLTNLANWQLLAAATSSSWRYEVMHETAVLGVLTLMDADPKTGKPMRWASFSNDTFETLPIETALFDAAQLPQVKKRDYEVRFLDIPGLYFRALWLHGRSDDILIPLSSTFDRKLNAHQAYSENDILPVLQPEAERDLKEPAGFR